MKSLISLLVVTPALSFASACSQPPVSCTVSTFTGYAAKYQLVDGTGSCAERDGDIVGMASFNPAIKDADGNTVPNLNVVSLAIRTETLGAAVARAAEEGIVDTIEGHAPHAAGVFASPVPQDDLCTAELSEVIQQLPVVPGVDDEAEDPDDDVPEQPALDVRESWTDLQVYVTAAALGTQAKARYTVTDDVEGCTATYDVLAVFPAVFCDDVTIGEPLDIASIDDSGADNTVVITTATAHGLAVGDAIDVADVDDTELSYDGSYSVAEVIDETTIRTAEIDPFDGDDPDPAGTAGTIVKVTTVPNQDFCSAVALPEKGIATGTGISPDFPVVCDPALFMCVLDGAPSTAAFPVLAP